MLQIFTQPSTAHLLSFLHLTANSCFSERKGLLNPSWSLNPTENRSRQQTLESVSPGRALETHSCSHPGRCGCRAEVCCSLIPPPRPTPHLFSSYSGNGEKQPRHCWRLLPGWPGHDLVAGKWGQRWLEMNGVRACVRAILITLIKPAQTIESSMYRCFQSWLFVIGWPVGMVFSAEDSFSRSPHPSVACHSSSRIEAP